MRRLAASLILLSMATSGLSPIAATPVSAATGAPTLIHHQGRLFDTSGNLLGGSSGTEYCFKFSFYDDATVGGGDVKLWPTGSPSTMTVTVTNGVFGVNIGDTTAGGDTLDFDFESTDTAYLNVDVAAKVGATCASGDGAESFDTLSPRQRIVSSGYAINANTVSGFAASQSATGDQIPVLTSGNLVLGGTNPQLNATGSNTLTFQSGVTGNVQFFSSSNRIDSSGNLTLAGGTTTTALTIGSVALSAVGTNASNSGGTLVGLFDEFDNSNSTSVQAVLNDFDTVIGGLASGSSKWTDAGSFSYLTQVADDLVIGATSVAAASLFFDESAGQLSLGTDDLLGGSLKLFSSGNGITDVTLAADSSGNLDVTAAELTLTGNQNISGTLTVSTVDINAGAIDGTAIGASSASTGAFTTLSSTGVSTIGNNSATVAIDSSDWDISTTGVLTGVSFDANGSGNSISNIDNADLTNSSVTVTAGTGLANGGAVSLGGSTTLNVVSANGAIVANADNLAFTVASSADALSSTTSSGSGLEILSSGVTMLQGCANGELLKWNETSDVWACASDSAGSTESLDTAYNNGGTITVDAYNVLLNLSDATNDYNFTIDNATTGAIANAISIATSGSGSSFATAIDLSDADIGTALAIGSNDITVGGATLSSSEVALLDSGIALSELTDSGTFTAGTVDINGGAIDGTAIGANSASTGAFTTLSSTGATTLGNNSSTVAIDSTDWDVSSSGVITLAATGAQTTAIVVTDTDYTNALSIGDNDITGTTFDLIGTTSTIDFTNFDVASTGNILVAAGVGLDTNAAGALALGNTNATSVSVCNSAACDTFTVGTNADADTITIGEATNDTISIAGSSVSLVVGATTVAGAEITILDSGIAYSELTDSGTLTVTTVDINGGAIDGAAIGANSASTGAFTTLSSAGVTALGNNSATVAIDSSDWDISTTGAITGVSFDANGTGNSISNIDNADLTNSSITVTAGVGIDGGGTVALGGTVTLDSTLGTTISNSEITNDTIDFDKIIDAATLDAATSLTGSAGRTLTVARALTDATTENGVIFNFTAADTTSGTSSQFGLYLDNLASTEGLDASLVIDNSDADDSVAAAIKIINAGGGFTNIIDNAGTLISGSEINLLDGGIALSELTDSGTLTAGTVDINGGAIDGTAIGANSASTGSFTTLSSTGVTTIGNNSATVAIDSNDWDISTSGVVTGVSFDANGTGNSISNIDNADLTNSSVTVTAGNGLANGGAVSLGGSTTLNVVSANGGIVANADNIELTLAASANGLSSTTSSGSGLEILSSGVALLQGCANSEILKWNETSDVWACAADVDTSSVESLDTAYNNGGTITVDAYNVLLNLSDATNDYNFTIDNTTTGAIATAISVATSGSGSSIATAIDLSDADIGTALALGANDITVGGATLTSTEVALLDSGIALSELTDSGTLTAGTVDINGGAIDGTAIGANSASTGAFTTLSSTGVTALGNNSASVAVNSSSWDISTAGIVSGLTGLTTTGNVTVSGAQILGGTPLVFEGATDDDVTTSFAITDPTSSSKTITFQNASGTVAFLTDTISPTLSDNVANALDIQEGTNNYLNINTTNTSENIAFGNSSTNPTFSFLGSGLTTLAGGLTITGTTTANGSLAANGSVTLGDDGDTVAIDSSDWNISPTGAITGVSLDANGSGNSITNIETGDIADATITGDDLASSIGGAGLVLTSGTPDVLDIDEIDAADGTGSTSNNSGFEFGGTGGAQIGLLQGCANNEILKWTEASSVWGCATDATGGGTGTLDDAYTNGATISVDSANVLFNLADATNDYNFTIDNTTTGAIATAIALATSGSGATIATAIDLADADIGTALALGANDITVGGTTLASTEVALLDSGIALSELTDSGTLTAGTVDINGGAIDGTAIGANSASTGAFTTLSSTGATTLGNNSSTVAIDSTDWDVSSGGVITLAATGAQTTAIVVTDTDYTNALSIGDNDITGTTFDLVGTTSTIDFTNFDVASTGNILVAPGVGLDTNAAGALALGNTNATSVSVCNSAACDTVGIGTNADADAITIGESANDTISIAGSSVSLVVGATTVAGAEITILDGGIAYSELTDSGTLTVATVDINGGAIDGAAIGANSASTGAFTTLSSTGITALGNNSATVAIDSSDWNISATGAITGVDFDANGSGNTISNIENADLANDTIDFDKIVDAAALDTATSITGTAGETLTVARALTDATTENGVIFNFTAADTTSGTSSQFGLYLDNLASTEGLDASLVIDNSDADDSVAAAIKIINAGGGFTNIIDNAGTLISGSEINLLDGGIALSELTDSGTLTAGTVDINGGAIDGTAIGANSASSGAFTTLGTTGVTAIGNNSATVSVNSSDWDISATGAITGVSFDANGNGNSISNIDNADLTNSAVTVTAGAGLTDGGSVSLGAATTLNIASGNGAIVANADDLTFTVAASANALSSTTSSGSGLEILASGATLLQGCADTEILKWNEATDVWACAADTTGGSVSLDTAYNNGGTVTVDAYNVLFNLADATNDYNFTIDNSSAGAIASAFVVATSGGGSSFATAIDLSDADIGTALALGANDITVGGATLTSSEVALLDSGIALSELTDSGTLTAGTVDINGGAIDGTAIGANSASTGAFTTLSSTGATTLGNNSSTVAIDSTDWDVSSGGVITLAASGAQTTAIVVTDTDYTNALSIGDNDITGTTFDLVGTTSTIDFTNFDVASTGNILVAAGVGLDTNAAGALALGNTNATSVSVCNSAACDTVGIGTNADADAITIGEAANDTISIAGSSVSLVVGATTVAGAEITILDGGIAYSELTDSGTLTVTTVDINGGAIDGTAIGANSASTGAFTTLSSTGVTALGNNSATVAIDSSDWNISATGVITGADFDANGSGNSISNIENADLVNDTLDLDKLADALALDSTLSLTGTAGETLSFVRTLTNNTTENGLLLNVTASDTGAGTTSQFGFYIDNLASTEGLDASLVIDNSDADDAVGAAIKIVDAGGTFTNIIDNAGTLISGTELNLLDGGVALSELTDSGTFTAGTVDINGGAIDGTAIGANAASTGAFTTLSSTGATSLGNNSSTVAIDSTDWDVSSGGVVTLAATGAQTTAIVVTDTDYTNALSIGDNDITGTTFDLIGTTSTIDFTNFDVASTGNILVAAGVGLDTNAAGALALGNTNATSVSVCNSAACDTVGIGTNTDADTITIGEATNDTISIAGSSVSLVVGATTVAGAEITILDGGIAYSELTDSGTLTVTTVDINGGAIDGAAIGANSASTGAFTTLSSTGVTALGNNSATVAVNSSDWDIDATGTITGVALDANGSGNAITNIENADLVNDTLDLDKVADALALDTTLSLTGTAGETISFVRTLTNNTTENGLLLNVTASDTGAGTSSQFGFYIDNLASTEGLDASLVIDNSDADDAVAAAIKIVDAGGTFTNIIDNAGTLISGSEINLLDGGVALSELTDSGTLTAGTVDINGGAIDGTAIGANSASSGAFTTLTSTGVTTLGNNSATVAINSNDWDISTAGAITGVSFDANGSGNTISNIDNADLTNDTIDFDKIVDAAALDAASSITGTAGETFTVARSLTDATTENGVIFNFTAADTTSGTSSQFGLYIDNLASTEGLDASLVIDNSDADDAVGAAIKIVNAGGNFTNIIDNAGTLISGSEINLLDGGVALSELTDSGTLTAGTVDINGGAIDGTAIGANSASSGAFTTLSSTGITALGNNSATVAIDSSDWNISTTGAITGVDLDANGSGNSVTNIENADLVNDTLDLDKVVDALALDSTLSLTGTAGETITLVRSLTNNTTENGVLFNITASDTGAGTSSQFGLYVDNLASTEGLDASLVIDNSDADDAVGAAIKIVDAGGTFTNIIDNAGTLISGTEINILDGGIALGDITDSGTFTAGTVDINGGAIDGTAIGANSASTGAFTTLSSTGVTALGNNSATVAIDSSDWNISATGAITGADFDANGSGNSISNIENADLVNDTLDLDKLADALALDSTLSLTGTAGETITFARTLTNNTTENGLLLNVTASDTGAGTTSQFGLYIDNLASTEGLDAGLVIDNSDADDSVAAAIKIVDAGGTFTNIIDNAGTLISGSEINLLDGGIALSELTDSGTLTAGTVDINGGAIDGAAIGANSASSGAFTTLSTTGITALGNNSATVAINSSDWDISTAGAITGVSLDANGSGNSISNIETGDIADGTIDADDLDFATEDGAAADGECLKFETSGGGDFLWGSCGGAGSTWDTIGDAAGNGAVVMAQTTQTLDWDMSSDAALDALTVTLVNDVAGSNSQRAFVVTNSNDGGASGTTEALIVINNADTNEAVTDGLLFADAGGTFTDFIDTPSSVFKVAGSGDVTLSDLIISGGNINPSANLTIGDNGDSIAIDSTDWDISANGVLTLATTGTPTTAIDATDTGYTNALSIGTNDIVGTTGGIDFTNIDITSNGAIVQQLASPATGLLRALVISNGSPTGQTAGTEASNILHTAYTRTWATGAITAQREVYLGQPTYAFAGASTISDAANLYIEGAPASGTNATITRSYAQWVDSGNVRFDGSLMIGATSASSALHVNSAAANTAAILTVENTNGNFQVFRTDATPESSVTGSIGDLAIDSTNGILYAKASGSGTTTGWKTLLMSQSPAQLTSISANDDVDFNFNTDGAGSENFVIDLTHATDVSISAMNVGVTNTAAADTGANAVAIFSNENDGGATGTLDAILSLNQSDVNELVGEGILFTVAAGNLTNALSAADAQITNAVNAGNNYILFDAIQMAELSTGTLTIRDTSDNDLVTIVDNGSNGTLTVTGDLAVTGGDITSASATFNFLDAASNSTTLDIGGVTTDLGNTINIATESTTADILTIGNTNASTTFDIYGGNDWSISQTGDLVVESITGSPTAWAIDASGNVSFVGGNFTEDLIITGGDITSTSATFNFLDAASNSTTIDIGGVTTSLANTVNIATNATAADAVTIGSTHASSTLALRSGDWAISSAGAITGASFDANGTGNSISNIESADILDGTLDADDLDQATEDGSPADGECLKFETSGGGDFKWDTCAAGGGTAWNDISDPTAVTSITFDDGETSTFVYSTTAGDQNAFIYDINQVDDGNATDDFDAMRFDLTSESGDAGDTFDGIVINWENGTANTIMDSAIKINNAETTAGTMTDGLVITSTGVADGITDAIDVSSGNLNNAINIGANFFLMDGVRILEGTTGTVTIEDTSGNDLLTITDTGTAGTLTPTGQIVASNLGVEFSESDSNATCAAGNYNIYADTSETKIKVCENGTVHDIAPITENIYTSNSTYTKASDAVLVFVRTIAAGGGGGGGAMGNNAAGGGGTGGGGGAYVEKYFDASDLASTVEVTVGSGGNAGAGSAVNNTAGGAGGVGGNSCFSSSANCAGTIYQRAFGGGAGRAGQIVLVASGGAGGGGSGSVGNNGAAANAAGGTAAYNVVTGSTGNSLAGGGAGGTINAAGGGNAEFGGGGGGGVSLTTSGGGGGSLRGGGGGGAGANGPNRAGGNGGLAGAYTSNTGAAGGNATGTAGTAGTNGNSNVGGGGGGGGGVAAGAGAVGGNGGAGGGGGGGGAGGGATGQVGGNGGAGGRGEVRVWTIKGTGADLAEIYSTNDPELLPGDVVSLDPTLRAGVKKSTTPYDPNAIGIISTTPSIVMGSVEDHGAHAAVVALAGRVPVKVSAENGPIKPGDLLTSSSTPGVAMKATKAGQIVGQAITSYSGGLEELPIVTAFIKTDYSNGAALSSLIPGLEMELPAEELADGEEAVVTTEPEQGVSLDLSTQALQYFMHHAEELAATVDLSEITADRITAGLEVITPRLLAGTVQTDVLKPATGSTIQLALSEGGEFVIQGQAISESEVTSDEAATTSVIRFDSTGNAHFAGTVTADAISANSITGLDIFAERIAVLSDAVDGLSEDTEEVTTADLVNISDMIAMVSSYTTGLAGQTAAVDQTLLARLDSEAAAQVIVNDSLIAGLAALDARVATLETTLTANSTNLADIAARITAVEGLQTSLDVSTLDLTGSLSVQGLATFAGGLLVDTIGSIGEAVSFLGDQIFIGRPYFNEDTGGFAVIRQGDREVRVNFTEAYLEQPVVQASVTFETPDVTALADEAARQAALADQAAAEAAYLLGDIRYVITNKSKEGFTIVLSQAATVDLRFSWIALAVQAAGLDESNPEMVVPEPSVEPVIEEVIEEGVVDPFDSTTPDNLNPDFAPLEDNVPEEFQPLEDNLPLEDGGQPVTEPEVPAEVPSTDVDLVDDEAESPEVPVTEAPLISEENPEILEEPAPQLAPVTPETL